MKRFILLLTAAIFGYSGNASYFEWDTKEITLTGGIVSFNISSNETQFNLKISNDLYSEGNDRYSLYLWVYSMSCLIFTPLPDGSPDYSLPNYLTINSLSSSVTLSKWNICDNITDGNQPGSQFNDGFHNIGLGSVNIKPIGEHWSDEGTNAVIGVSLSKHKTIQIGEEMDQADINILPDITYVAELSEFNKLSSIDCAMSVVISKMSCESPNYLEISTVADNGDIVTTTKICSTGSNLDEFIESKDKVILRRFGDLQAKVSISALNSSSSDKCPEGYFDCQRGSKINSVTCIPSEWICDGRPNCPTSVDESAQVCNLKNSGKCKIEDWERDFRAAIIFTVVLIIFCILLIITLIRFCFRLIMGSSRNVQQETVYNTTPPPTYDEATIIRKA